MMSEEVTEVTEEAGNYTVIDPLNVDDDDNYLGFKEPEKQENTQLTETKTETVEEIPEVPLEKKPDALEVTEDNLLDHIDFFASKKEETQKPALAPPPVQTPAQQEIQQQVEEKKPLSHSEQFLNDLSPYTNLFYDFLDQYPNDPERLKYHLNQHLQQQASFHDVRESNRLEREALKKERDELQKVKDIEVSRPAFNRNVDQASLDNGWKNSKQMMDVVNDKMLPIMTAMFEFNRPEENKYRSTEDFKKEQEAFSIKLGSNRKILDTLQDFAKKIFYYDNREHFIKVEAQKLVKEEKERLKGLSTKVRGKTKQSVPKTPGGILQINT
jgi:hypothetical protein